MNTIETQAPAQTAASRALAFVGDFHLCMAFAISALLIISLAGCALTGIELPELGASAIVFLVLSAMLLPLPAYWYEKGRADLLDSTLTVLWAFLLRLIIPILVQVAARLRMPLQDSFLGRADDHLGVSVPAIMAWAAHHWLGNVLNRSYAWVIVLLPLAVLLPVLAGRLKYAREFLVANLISFAIGIPVFALLPAIGPWRYYHLPPTQSQIAFCEGPLLALRLPGAYVLGSHEAGVVCFPSFHVGWAILIAAALWGFRSLRIPLALVTGMVILSTLTTGWHYFVDVLGGILLAIISILLAKRLTRRMDTIRQPRGWRPVGPLLARSAPSRNRCTSPSTMKTRLPSVLFCILMVPVRLVPLCSRAKSVEQQPGAPRAQILSQLSDLPGRHLAMVAADQRGGPGEHLCK